MPVFTNLDEHVTEAPFDTVGYERRVPACREIAGKMPLVHVTGKGRTFATMVSSGVQQIPTSADPEY
ncbi:MAG: hypothetical protein NTY19_17360 [Planctomycetota bacterium]|nr:hypothetical protein [Planctomycetota bacterium]